MDISILDEVAKKYGYDKDLQYALFICVQALTSYYGKDALPGILNMLENVPIHAQKTLTKEVTSTIEKMELGDLNKHIEYLEAPSPYGHDTTPGSTYNYEIIFDNDMNPTFEKRWIIVETRRDAWNGEAFYNTFGTYINLPYLLHELNHAYAMSNPYIVRNGDKIVCKHGMYISEYTIGSRDGKYTLTRTDYNDLLLEEAINEYLTNEMLCEYFKVTPDDLCQMLRSIHYTGSSYNPIILGAAQRFIYLMGKDKIISYRINNDDTVIDEFNDMAQSSEIGKKYYTYELPFDNFTKNAMAVYLCGIDKYHHTLEEYKEMQAKNACELFGPLYAYQEELDGTMNLKSYDEYRSEVGLDTDVPTRL